MHTIPSIQLLRAVAALSVTLCHFSLLRLYLFGLQNEPLPLHFLASGVDLFFVISGFIIVHSSVGLFDQSGGWRIFLMRRLARITPLYWATTAIAIPLMVLPWDVPQLLGSLLFIPYRTSSGITPLHGVGWTLNFEMFFYVLFTFVVATGSRAAIPALCVFLCLIVAAGKAFTPTTTVLLFWSDPIALEFAGGMLLALTFQKRVTLPASVRVCVIVLGALAVVFYTPGTIPSGYRLLFWGVPAVAIVAGTVLGPQPTFGCLTKLIMMLGDASFALYLVHPLVAAFILRAWGTGIEQYGWERVFGFGYVFSIAISMLSYYSLERPLTRQITQWSGLRVRRVSSVAGPAS